jgi:hypothetical protein
MTMTPLRIVGSCLLSALCAFGVSVGVALAQPSAADHAGHGAKGTPSGVCFLHDII